MTSDPLFTPSTAHMLLARRLAWLVALTSSLLLLPGCGESVRRVGEITVEFDEDVDFSEFTTFTVLTEELVPEADELDTEAKLFNEEVNERIIDAMTAPPVCMTFIEPERVVAGEEPDLFAGNGLAREVREGTQWRCVGGWWWGAWGWFWDPCLWRKPVPVEFEVGSLYLPVGPRPDEDADPEPVFIGIGRRLLERNVDLDTEIDRAVRLVFDQWPVRRSCSP